MNNNKISNQKTEVPKGINLNDKDYSNELLTCLKEMEKNLTVAKTEASNETLYNEYKQMYETVAALERRTYELMFRNGWYELEQAEEQKINEKLNMLSTELQDLNANG